MKSKRINLMANNGWAKLANQEIYGIKEMILEAGNGWVMLENYYAT